MNGQGQEYGIYRVYQKRKAEWNEWDRGRGDCKHETHFFSGESRYRFGR